MTSATPPAAPIQLPPPAQSRPEAPERYLRTCRLLDGLLVVVVLAFAFLTASFAVRNSDFFRHLASGRLVAGGNLPDGTDPFTWGSGNVYWVNHSWLFDFLIYSLYSLPSVGPEAVVVFKALLVVVLAGVMLAAGRRPGQPLWVPAACTGLAVLTLSPRLFLQPACTSYLFLGLTLWLLHRPRQRRAARAQAAGLANSPAQLRDYLAFGLLPPLFLLWANLDGWFVLGPALAGLYLAGEGLRQALGTSPEDADAPGRGELRTLGLALVVGVASCLVNPHGYRAIELPETLGLSAAAEAVLKDSQFSPFLLSPAQASYALQPNLGLSVAGWAYFLFLLLGVASFVLAARGPGGVRRVVGWRLFTWLPLALLSLANVRGVAFFAVVAGPVTALNLLDFAAGLGGVETMPARRRNWALAGRGLVVLAGLAAVVATVPGWVQALPHLARRVGWGVEPDVSLRQAAEEVRAWGEAGRVPADAHWFNLSPEIANYLAWYAPGQRGYLDQRVGLFGAAARDFITVRRGLIEDVRPEDSDGEKAARGAWRRSLRDRGVRYLIVQTSDRQQGLAVMLTLLARPEEWVPCYLDGRTGVFGWKDPDGPAGEKEFARLRLDFARQAFGPNAERAPDEGPGRLPEEPAWWTELWQPPTPPDLAGDAAVLHFTRFDALAPRYDQEHRRAFELGEAAGLAGCFAAPGGPLVNGGLFLARVDFTYRILHGEPIQPPGRPLQAMDMLAGRLHDFYAGTQDAGPPESLYLAIRAARRALAVNPDEGRTHFLLGRAYFSLWLRTREHVLGNDLAAVATIRRTQIATALNNALKLDLSPVMAQQAHNLLAVVYGNINARRPYLDLVARHRREQLKAMQEAGPLPGETAKNYGQQVEQLEKVVEDLERRLRRQQDQYEVNAANKPPLKQAEAALENGLALKALEVLENADPGELFDPARGGGQSAVTLALELSLTTGQLDKALDLLDPKRTGEVSKEVLAGQWLFHVRRAAAAGDYARADALLAQALEVGDETGRLPSTGAGLIVGQRIGQFLLHEAPQAAGMPWQVLRHMPRLVPAGPGRFAWAPPLRWPEVALETTQTSLQLTGQEGQLRFLRGWLALEAGHTAPAREYFRAAKAVLPPLGGWALAPFANQAAVQQEEVRELADRYLDWIDAAR
jgi:hypothetical protein